jgi:hypothetical protein
VAWRLVRRGRAGRGLPQARARRGERRTRCRRRRLDQHQARGADQAITDAIDRHVQAKQRGAQDDDGTAGRAHPGGLMTLMAQKINKGQPMRLTCTRAGYPDLG